MRFPCRTRREYFLPDSVAFRSLTVVALVEFLLLWSWDVVVRTLRKNLNEVRGVSGGVRGVSGGVRPIGVDI